MKKLTLKLMQQLVDRKIIAPTTFDDGATGWIFVSDNVIGMIPVGDNMMQVIAIAYDDAEFYITTPEFEDFNCESIKLYSLIETMFCE